MLSSLFSLSLWSPWSSWSSRSRIGPFNFIQDDPDGIKKTVQFVGPDRYTVTPQQREKKKETDNEGTTKMQDFKIPGVPTGCYEVAKSYGAGFSTESTDSAESDSNPRRQGRRCVAVISRTWRGCRRSYRELKQGACVTSFYLLLIPSMGLCALVSRAAFVV